MDLGNLDDRLWPVFRMQLPVAIPFLRILVLILGESLRTG